IARERPPGSDLGPHPELRALGRHGDLSALRGVPGEESVRDDEIEPPVTVHVGPDRAPRPAGVGDLRRIRGLREAARALAVVPEEDASAARLGEALAL